MFIKYLKEGQIKILSHQYTQCVSMLSNFSHVWCFVTPGTVAHSSSVHGILQARILEWAAMPSFRG